jgi:hypothetical protein
MALQHQIVMLSACLMSLAAADNYGRVSRISVICCMPTADECFRGTEAVILVLKFGVCNDFRTHSSLSDWFAATVAKIDCSPPSASTPKSFVHYAEAHGCHLHSIASRFVPPTVSLPSTVPTDQSDQSDLPAVGYNARGPVSHSYAWSREKNAGKSLRLAGRSSRTLDVKTKIHGCGKRRRVPVVGSHRQGPRK